MVRRTNRFPFRGGVPPSSDEDDDDDDDEPNFPGRTSGATTPGVDETEPEIDFEEEEEPAPQPTSIADLVGDADPEEFDRTFRITKSDIPLAVGDEIPIGFPFEGIPRVAMVFNFNYEWDSDEEQWVKAEGNGGLGVTVLDRAEATIASGGTTDFQTGVTDPTITPFLQVRWTSEPTGDFQYQNYEAISPNSTGDLVHVALWDSLSTPSQWVARIANNATDPADIEYIFGRYE